MAVVCEIIKEVIDKSSDKKIILQYFSEIFDSAEKVELLREIILEMAIEGKLVEQNESDEETSVLLEKIQVQRELLIKEKKIKRDKIDEKICERDNLPKGWGQARLGDLAIIFNGNSINAKTKELIYGKVKRGYDYIGTKEVGFDALIEYDNGIRIPYDESKFKIAHKNALLICAEGGSAGRKIAITNRDICFGNKLYAIECFDGIENKFLYYLLKSKKFFNRFKEQMTGMIGGVSLVKFKNLMIDIPPIDEQKRIVNKVDFLFAICDKLHEALNKQEKDRKVLLKSLLNNIKYITNENEADKMIELLIGNLRELLKDGGSIDELKSCILNLGIQGLFIKSYKNKKYEKVLVDTEIWGGENIFKIPENWEVKKLEDVIVEKPRNGYSPKGVDFITKTKNLTLTATSSGWFRKDKFKYIDEEIPQNSHLWLEKDDILIQRSNSIEYVGVSCIYNGNKFEYIYPDLMMKIRVRELVDNKYIYYMLSAPITREYFRRNASGTAKTMIKINQKTVMNTPIIVPSIEEQKIIVEKLDLLIEICNKLKREIEQLNKIKGKVESWVINMDK